MEIRIDIEPLGKQRPRMSRRGGVYTPSKTRVYERILAQIFKSKYKDSPIESAVCLNVSFFFKKAKSSKLVFPTKKPDLDNCVKAVKDAGNGILWKDDSQIVHLEATKFWSDVPCVVVRFWEFSSYGTS